MCNTGHTHPKVTQALHDAASTISREIKRYRAVRADKQAWAQALRPGETNEETFDISLNWKN